MADLRKNYTIHCNDDLLAIPEYFDSYAEAVNWMSRLYRNVQQLTSLVATPIINGKFTVYVEGSDGEDGDIYEIVKCEENMKVYAAFRSAPDYHAPPPSLHSLHKTFDGARKALYPDKDYTFRQTGVGDKSWWEGPDGFGMIRLIEVQP